MTDRKKASLQALYRKMDSAEIEYRLAQPHGELNPMAREAAQAELLRRRNTPDAGAGADTSEPLEMESGTGGPSGLLGQWLLASALLGVFYVFVHFVLGWSSKFMLGLLIVVGAPTLCVFIARALPTLGKVAGLALFLYAMYFYASTPLAGNTGVERGVERTFLIAYTLGYFALGVACFVGACFRGSDDELQGRLNQFYGDLAKVFKV